MGHIIVDVAFLAFAIISVLLGAKRGLLRSVVHFFKYIFAFVAASALGPAFSSPILGYIVVFIGSLIVLSVLAYFLTKIIKHMGLLGRLNTLLGAVFGALMAVTILLVVASLLKHFFGDSTLYTDSVVVKFVGESLFLEKLSFLNIGKKIFADFVFYHI